MGAAFAHSQSQKRARVVASKQCWGMFQRNSKEFLRVYVNVDETWIHYYTPETKNHSKMWTGPGETRFFPWFCFNNEIVYYITRGETERLHECEVCYPRETRAAITRNAVAVFCFE